MSWRNGRSKGCAVEPGKDRSVAQRVVRPLAVIAVIVLAASLLANSMTKEVGRDEQMYCTAGVLLARGLAIYKDFSYPSQLPYHPLLLAAVYRGLGTTHYLLVGRLVSCISDILVVVLILLIYRSIFGAFRREGLWFSLAAVTLYAFNPFVDYAAGYAWNHDVVILCVVLSFYIFVTTDFQHRSRFWRVGLVGVLLTVATFMRVTTALVELLFLGIRLFAAGGSLRRRSRTALPFSLAGFIVAIWPVWVMFRAPRAFWLNLVRIPALYGRWLHEIGMTFGKVDLTVAALLTPGYLVLVALAGYFVWTTARGSLRLEAQERPKAILAALLPLLFFVIAYVPPTMWQQYLAVPVPFIVIAFAYPLVGLRRRAGEPNGRRRYRTASYLAAGAAIVSVLAQPAVLSRSPFVFLPERWTPVELHRVSADIADDGEEPELVLTLGPLYALEGGRDIYPQLACGSIVYRVADRMLPEERQITRTVGPETLDEMVRDRPPAAIFVGVESSHFSFLEDPLRQLTGPDWQRGTYQGTLQVYRPPPAGR